MKVKMEFIYKRDLDQQYTVKASFYYRNIDKNKKNKFDEKNNNALDKNIDFSSYWHHFGSAWSQINDDDMYYEYQENLSKAIKVVSPLEWELIHWHKAIRYYG